MTRLARATSLVQLEVLVSALAQLGVEDLQHLLQECDHAVASDKSGMRATGFWRTDKDKDPELRHTVLTLVAFHDLRQKIAACDGDRDRGIESFLTQNDGEGWLLPETLRLADYGLGHDDRAQEHQPVASRLGPRFYDWQLAQSPEDSWRECRLHARNLLGGGGAPQGQRAMPDGSEPTTIRSDPAPVATRSAKPQGLFD